MCKYPINFSKKHNYSSRKQKKRNESNDLLQEKPKFNLPEDFFQNMDTLSYINQKKF